MLDQHQTDPCKLAPLPGVDPILTALAVALVGVTKRIDVIKRALTALATIEAGASWALVVRIAPDRYEARTSPGSCITSGDLLGVVLGTCGRRAVLVTHTAKEGPPSLSMCRRVHCVSDSLGPELVLAAWWKTELNRDGILERAAGLIAAALHAAGEFARLTTLCSHDALTGVFNRRRTLEVLDQEIERATRYQRPLSVLFIDVDHFKQVNDGHGHRLGDLLLTVLAERIGLAARSCDIIGRMGGDEFVIILPETTLGAALEVAERIHRDIATAPIITETGNIDMSVTIGAAALDEAPAAGALLELADLRMLEQKRRRGRPRLVRAIGAEARAR